MEWRGYGIIKNFTAKIQKVVDRIVLYDRFVFLYLFFGVGDRGKEKESGLNGVPDNANIFEKHIDRAEKQVEAERKNCI